MKKCPICINKDADKKNAHLIPWFLIKNSITQGGTGERDMELSFTIDPHSFTKMYTGRSVLPENVEEYGNFHDLQKEKENPYTRDNIVCWECENKFSRLEAIFASQFSDKKLRSAFQFKLPNLTGHSIFMDSKYNHSLYELLIQSIFYRCSIGRFDGFQLKNDVEKKIEENLRVAFSGKDLKKITPHEEIKFPNKFPILTCSFFISEGEDPTKNFIVINQSKFPYFITAGKWMFQLFEAEKHLRSTIEWLYGLHYKLNTMEAYNIVKDTSHVILLETKAGEVVSNNLLEYIVKEKTRGLKKYIRGLYFHITKHKPNATIAQYIFQQYFIHSEQGKSELESMVCAFMDFDKCLPKLPR